MANVPINQKTQRVPTMADLQAAYPDKAPEEIAAAWNAKYPGYALEGAPEAPTGLLGKIRGFANEHPDLTKAGLMTGAGVAAMPFTGGLSLPAVMAIEALAAGGGSLASAALQGKSESAGELGTDMALAAGTAGAAPYIGPALKLGAKAAHAIGDAIPWGAGFWSPATAATKAAARISEPAMNGLAKVVDSAGGVVNKLRGAAGDPLVAEEAAATVSPVVRRAQAQARQITGESTEVPYRMGSEPITGPAYKPSARPSGLSAQDEMLSSLDIKYPENITAQGGVMRSEGLPQESVQALNNVVGRSSGRGLNPEATEKLMNVHSGGWQDVPLDTPPGPGTPSGGGRTPVTRIVDNGMPIRSDKPQTWFTKGHLDDAKAAQLNDMYKSGKGQVMRGHVENPISFDATDEFGNEIGSVASDALKFDPARDLSRMTEEQAQAFRKADVHGVGGFSKVGPRGSTYSPQGVRSADELRDFITRLAAVGRR